MMEPKGEIHEFWFRRGEPHKRIEAMHDLREYIDTLPKTSRSFSLSQVGDWHRSVFTEEMLVMVGSWEIPDILTGTSSARDWMNPNYTDKHRFPEVYAQCACGAVLTRGYFDGGNRLQQEHNHSEDCGTPERLRARAEMLEKRRDAIRRALRLGRSGRQIAPRIGVRAKGLGEIAKSLGLSIDEEKEIYRARSGRTYAYLREEFGVKATDLGKAYGCHHDTLQRRAKEYTEIEYDRENQQWLIPTEEEEESTAKMPDWMEGEYDG